MQTEVKSWVATCDFCGKEDIDHQCSICDADLCGDCVEAIISRYRDERLTNYDAGYRGYTLCLKCVENMVGVLNASTHKEDT